MASRCVSTALRYGLLLGCMARGSCAAQAWKDWDITQSVRSDYATSSTSLDDRRHFIGLEWDVRAHFRPTNDDDLSLNLVAGAHRLGHADGANDLGLRKVVWHHQMGPLDMWLGKQKIPWGRADAINPTDFFTPRDFTVDSVSEADQRLAITAVRADVHFSQADTLSLVREIGFTASRHPVERLVPVRSPARPVQWGARYTSTAENLDWSLYYFEGKLRLPVASLAARGTLSSVATPIYPGMHALGADFAHNAGRYSFRGELSYARFDDPRLQPRLPSQWSAVIGGERSWSHLNVNTQLVARYAPAFQQPRRESTVAVREAMANNALVIAQSRKLEYGLTVRLGLKASHDTVALEVFGHFNLNTHNYYLRPLMSYQASDHIKLLWGADIYAGADDTFYGALKKNRTAFARWEYIF